MKKFYFIMLVAFGVTLGVSAQNKIWNLVNSSGSDVIAVTDQGNLTVSGSFNASSTTASVVSATSISATSISVNSVNATSVVANAITVSSTTGIVSTASALAAPTNSASAGLRVRINGTNYVIAVYPN